jgi:hypothetical protein
MPRFVAVCVAIFVGGCSFEADYSGGGFACNDGRCPAGLDCIENVCRIPIDAAPDDAEDAPDAREPALTCADPGILTGDTVMGDTTNKPMVLSSMCGGFVMNGRETVYSITVGAGDSLRVAITGARKAYVIATCTVPAPACLGNTRAVDGLPITVTPAAGDAFVIVDDENPANTGAYTLTVTVE